MLTILWKQNLSGRSPWRSKVISPSEEQINGAKADTQQHILIPLNASQQQATSSWLNGTELSLSTCNIDISRELYMKPQLAIFRKLTRLSLWVGRVSTDPRLNEKYIILSLSMSSFRGSNATVRQVWRYTFNFTFYYNQQYNQLVSAALLLSGKFSFKHRQKIYLINT